MAKIYMAGGFYGDYKQVIEQSLGDKHTLLDPEIHSDPGNRIPGRYVGRDLGNIEESRIVLAVQTDYPYVYGMAAEVGYTVGYVRGQTICGNRIDIDVIYVCLTKRIDGFLSGLARAAFTDLQAACDFIDERY